jgi:hypothetical protein
MIRFNNLIKRGLANPFARYASKMGVIDISYGQVKQTHWLKAG